MLKTRIIPLLLIKDGLLKKPLRFTERERTVSNAISQARVFESRQVDELILLDIGRPSTADQKSARSINSVIVKQIAEELTVPLTVGGGVRNIETFGQLVSAGAEKITINSGAIDRPEFITEAAKIFGTQCVVVSIDIKRHEDNSLEVYSHNGRVPTGLTPSDWARAAVGLGAGELLVNTIDCDGTMEGFDIDAIESITNVVKVPVIAAGGAGTPDDFVEVVKKAKVAAVSAGSIFFFRKITPLMVKEKMRDSGISVRIEGQYISSARDKSYFPDVY